MRRRLLNIVVSLGVTTLAAGFLIESEAVSRGIRTGLALCAGTLIPSLFPFMALSGFLSLSQYGAALARPLRPLWRYVYRVPEEAGAVVLLSLIGGYPVGAKGISSLLRRGVIDEETAGRMLCFCVNCGPSFLIGAVGSGMLGDRTAGLILFCTQTAATLLIGIGASLFAPVPSGGASGRGVEKGGTAFVSAVSGASSAMLVICAFAALFSGVLSLLRETGLPERLAALTGTDGAVVTGMLGGFFEVTSGCVSAAGLGGERGFLLLSLAVSFGGLSVLYQVMSCFNGQDVRFGRFLLSRLLHMPLAALMALPLWRMYCGAVSVFSRPEAPVARIDGTVWAGSLCLIGMCTILLFTIYPGVPLHKPGKWDKIIKKNQKKG